MNSRERVLRAIAHEKTDRMPSGYTAHQEVTDKLIKHFGVADEHEMLCALHVDTRRIPCSTYLPHTEPDEAGYITNMWGVKTKEKICR